MAKPIQIGNPTGLLDMRSNPIDLAQNSYRYRLNWGVEAKSKLCRIPGWVKILDRDLYENFDGHDQLESITGVTGRRPYTFLFEATSSSKSKILLMGTDRVLFALSLGTGNMRVLSDALGVDGVTRWSATQNVDTVILTNDYDPPQYWTFDGAPVEAGNQSVAPIPDLVTLGITRVGVVVTWQGSTFYMNVVKDGVARTHHIFWSDAEKPLSLIAGEESVAGDVELDSQESILAAAPLGNALLVYTTRGIWEVSLVGGEEVFAFAKRYSPEKSSDATLAYRNSLVNMGESHVFMSATGIYEYSFFVAKPTLVEWMHKASSVIFDTIDKSRCDWQIAAFNPNRREIWFSWVAIGEDYPTRTLACNFTFPAASIVDHGFTAFGYFQPNEPVTTLGQWIKENCICDIEEFSEVFGELIKEGGSCRPEESVLCETQPDSFFTTVTQELEDGIVMEDWNEEEDTENSLCARLAPTTISSLCVDEAKRDQCNASKLFVMASAEDFCLKEMSESYYRERCIGYKDSDGNDHRIIAGTETLDVCGTYEVRGYRSILRSGPLAFRDIGNEKELTGFIVDAIAAAALIPGRISMRFGVSSMALDPNDPNCGIVWYDEDPKTLDCVAGSPSSHAANATRPGHLDDLSFPAYAIGRYLYYEITIDNPDSEPIDIGAAVCVQGYVAEVSAKSTRG